ncbi:glycoside hydrolase family 13 protein [Streptoalloteichus hindustanus]|uniref:Alpha-glucosidase n=1 Tax=Streptoalloteichus hindustanus TaxID=2017 RepID=A0A1M5JRH5_STRHI|nr:glycoside hydrolase family 13 protein [Streptoalloteichus hindustanus]SHG43186.1 alpha-glucosidase [Streptoalloteichus hindustanus]
MGGGVPERREPDRRWWRDAVIYQVYIRSFADGNGDGIGDINGIRGRLDYLADLGVDALWINPWYVSPMADGGYDVADFRRIDPVFGSVADAVALFKEARERGLRVIVDLVPNHTSDQHAWFQEALRSAPGGRERRRYHFRDGRGERGELPPNNWRSVFGGPAWTRVPDGQWYLHLFAPEQPDLNWENPEVLAEFDDVLRFWLDRGVDGFRIDVAHGMAKDGAYPDEVVETVPGLFTHVEGRDHPYLDREDVHEIYRRWREVLDYYPGERIAVAEAWVSPPERLARYVRPDELHQAFNFDFLQRPWVAEELRAGIDLAISANGSVGATPTWVLSNHDVVRVASRLGLPADVDPKKWLLTDGREPAVDAGLGLRRARAAALLTLALPGSTYVYQGEELGLPEVADLPAEVLQDPIHRRSGGAEKGRDGCRVPLPWTADAPGFGFGPGGESWLPQPADWGALSVAEQRKDEGSTLRLYQTALRLRRQLPVEGELVWSEDAAAAPADVLVFRRASGFRCVVNLGAEAVELPAHDRVLVSSVPLERAGDRVLLPSDAAVWLA